MPNWFAYKRLSNNEVGFCTDDTQGFADLQANPAFSLHAIAAQPTADQFFDVSDNVVKPVTVVNAINPPVTKTQAAAILKALLEDPPTGADPWTALQQQQCLYLLLLGLFRDLKNGKVY